VDWNIWVLQRGLLTAVGEGSLSRRVAGKKESAVEDYFSRGEGTEKEGREKKILRRCSWTKKGDGLGFKSGPWGSSPGTVFLGGGGQHQDYVTTAPWFHLPFNKRLGLVVSRGGTSKKGAVEGLAGKHALDG